MSAEYIKQEKIRMINNYISSIDLSVINTNRIAEDLRHSLGEKPAVKINYQEDTMITEKDGSVKGKRVEKIESISVIFTIEREINGKTMYFPVEETFLLE